MKWLTFALQGLAATVVAAGIAWMMVQAMEEMDLLGSCFEGACGYAALFFWFPLWWAILSAVFIGLLWWWRRQ